MNKQFFPKLALNGIVKNKKFYLPYLLSCIGMVMMFFIMQSLSYSELLHDIKGGNDIEMVLSLGKFVISVFALLYLFYTNSFLTKKRYKEFGLYSILGMDRAGIGKIVLWESFFVSATGLAAGIVIGIVFSKLAELGFLNIVHGNVDYKLHVYPESIEVTLAVFVVIFLLITLNSLIQVRRSKPIELLRSENVGEKPVKANWILAVIGFAVLGVAYYLSVSIKTPLTALLVFFFAVILVIIATYMIFISGSVAVCRLLQNNKKYYYRKQHFVSVSSMCYRMKRNGAGLASICILSTMVLVMISSASSLYFGVEDSLNSRFPYNTEIIVEMNSIDGMTDEKINDIKAGYEKIFDSHGFTPPKVATCRYAAISGILDGEKFIYDKDEAELGFNYDDLRMMYFISVDDYNKMADEQLTLKENETFYYTLRCSYNHDSINIGDVNLKLINKLDKPVSISEANTLIVPSIFLIISDYNILMPLDNLRDASDWPMLSHKFYYGYDYGKIDENEAIEIYKEQKRILDDYMDGPYSYSSGCLASSRNSFIVTFGGLLFIAIVLSVMFIFAAAVIIYYKQVSEGYEDQKRFEIMQKVGMTKPDIKKSINSQILTVFFAPLLFAGVHLIFAFPFIWKILQLFNLQNFNFVVCVTIIAFIIFGIFYGLIYKTTAKAYYSIVTSGK